MKNTEATRPTITLSKTVRCITCGGTYHRSISAQTRHERTSMHHEGTGPMAPVVQTK